MVTPASSGRVHDPAQRVREVVEPVVTAAGLYLEDVAVRAAGRRSVVRIVVDLDEDTLGSLDLDDLGDVSREISGAMDAADPVRGEYVLEVSTPGTDRPLIELRHFRRARSRRVRLAMRDGTVVTGRLRSAEADGYELEGVGGELTRIAPADVARGTVEVELRRLHDDEEDPS